MNEHISNIHETEGITTEVQEITEDVKAIETNVTYATYLATLHDSEKNGVFWRTLAMTLLSFFAFTAILILIIILKI